jgi:D-arabinose 1-dehydrogenase-like Zn-dependent alcohol dehydrogenase
MAKEAPVPVRGTGAFLFLGDGMKALVLREKGRLRLEELPEPVAGADEVAIRVSWCALCRTDAKMWDQGHRDLVLPRVLGHEICGVRGDTGERCVVWPGESCGGCEHCGNGAENLCSEMRILGFNRDGGLAETVTAKRTSLIEVPYGLPDRLACMAEPLACALNALDLADIRPGMSVLVFGAGAVGLLIALAARAAGCSVSVVEISEEKLRMSKEFRHNLEIQSVSTQTRERFDVVVNACPAVETLVSGVSLLKSQGRFCLFSGFVGEQPVPATALNEIHYRQLHLVGAYGCTRSQMIRAVELLDVYQSQVSLLIQEEITVGSVESALPGILSGNSLKIVVNIQTAAWDSNS